VRFLSSQLRKALNPVGFARALVWSPLNVYSGRANYAAVSE